MPLFRRTADAAAPALRFLVEEPTTERFVYWVENRGRGVFSSGDADRSLANRSRSPCSARSTRSCYTWATLAVDGGVRLHARPPGPEHARTLVVPGHFDYQIRRFSTSRSTSPTARHPAFAKRRPTR